MTRTVWLAIIGIAVAFAASGVVAWAGPICCRQV